MKKRGLGNWSDLDTPKASLLFSCRKGKHYYIGSPPTVKLVDKRKHHPKVASSGVPTSKPEGTKVIIPNTQNSVNSL